MMRAKMKVASVTPHSRNCETLEFHAVCKKKMTATLQTAAMKTIRMPFGLLLLTLKCALLILL